MFYYYESFRYPNTSRMNYVNTFQERFRFFLVCRGIYKVPKIKYLNDFIVKEPEEHDLETIHFLCDSQKYFT